MMNSFPKSTDFTYHPGTKCCASKHSPSEESEMYNKSSSKPVQSNHCVDFNHNKINHDHFLSCHNHPPNEHCQSGQQAQSLQPSASNGRLDLSFTKCIFPADYLPYSRDKRRPMTQSPIDAPTMISSPTNAQQHNCASQHECDDSEQHCCYDNLSFQNCENSLSETETLGELPLTGSATPGTLSTTVATASKHDPYQASSYQFSEPSSPPFASAVNAILYSRQTPVQHRPTSDLIYSQPDAALLTPTPGLIDSFRPPKRSTTQQLQCCLTFVMFGTILAVLSLVVGFSFYLAIVTNFWSRPQSIYAIGGSFKVSNGDNFTMRLLNHTSTEFLNKSSRYENLLDRILDQSPIGESILSSEVHTFRSGSLLVFFRFYALKSRLDALLDMQSKAVINLGSIENVFVDEGTILSRLTKIAKTTFRQMRAQLRVTQPDIFIDSEATKINRIDLITRDAYRERLKAKWSLKKSSASLAGQQKRRALLGDPLRSSNLIQLDRLDEEGSLNSVDGADHKTPFMHDAERESDIFDNEKLNNRTEHQGASLSNSQAHENQSNHEIMNNKSDPEMETNQTPTTQSTLSKDDQSTISELSTTTWPSTIDTAFDATITTTEGAAKPTDGTPTTNNDSSIITLIDHFHENDDTTIGSVESIHNTSTTDDDGSPTTPATKNDIETTTSTSTVTLPNEYQVEGFEPSSTPSPANKTRHSKKLNITDDTIFDPILSTTKAPEIVSSYCNEDEFQCLTSGECVPLDDVCNQIMDCSDKSDEFGCKCVDYLYREENHRHKICDGVIDCQDQSDELNCPKCNQSQSFVCTGRENQCIANHRVCDGEEDCPNGDDEQGCISLADPETPNKLGVTYNQRGILLIRHHGVWGPLCFDNYEMELNGVHKNYSDVYSSPLGIEEMGQAVCRANSFDSLKSIDIKTLPGDWSDKAQLFFSINNTLTSSRQPKQPSSAMWSLLFQKTDCPGKKIAKIECTNFECGIRPVIPKLRRRIVGGQSSSFGSWPWQAALYREGEFQCGAVIIDNEWVLTAAHCFHTSKAAYWTVRAGLLRRGSLLQSYHEELRRIDQIVIHPDYVDKGFLNDIALLKLDKPLQFSKFIRTICLPDSGDVVERWHSQLCTTVGWGKLYEHGRIFPDTLQEVRLPIISSEECRKRTLFLPLYKITENMFCAGYERGGRDACLGDSGGPMMCQRDDGKWLLLGITSNGDGCGRAGRPGVYTKVSNYLKWIANVTSSDHDPLPLAHCDGHRCPLGKCLRNEQICDQIINCEDSSDELHCQ